MLSLLTKLFVVRFYSTNAGFFFLFFFIFFGAVQGSSLAAYHLSLMQSFFESTGLLLLVCFSWVLYHLKCAAFFLRTIDQANTRFLFSLQTFSVFRLWMTVLALYVAVYAPVLVYAFLAAWVGMQKEFMMPAASILFFQVISLTAFTGIFVYRLTHWQKGFRIPTINPHFPKHHLLYLFFYFTGKRKMLLFALKSFSILLLYIVLVWNTGRYDADAFLLFYLVILMAHSAVPYLAVNFFEKELAFWRNLPLSFIKRGLMFLLPYCLLMLPEAIYLFYAGTVIPTATKGAYLMNTIAALSVLTSFLYSDAVSRDDYLKAAFGLFFLTIFALHAEAYWFWISTQVSIAVLLFVHGFYRFEGGKK